MVDFPAFTPLQKEAYKDLYATLREHKYDVGLRRGDVWGPSNTNCLVVLGLAEGRNYVIAYFDDYRWKIGLYLTEDKAAEKGIILNIDDKVTTFQFTEFLLEILSSINGRDVVLTLR